MLPLLRRGSGAGKAWAGGTPDGWATLGAVSPLLQKCPFQRMNGNKPPHSHSAHGSASQCQTCKRRPRGCAPRHAPQRHEPFPGARARAPSGPGGEQARGPAAGDAGTKRAASTPRNATQPAHAHTHMHTHVQMHTRNTSKGPAALSQQRGRSPRDSGRVERGTVKGHTPSDSASTTFSR